MVLSQFASSLRAERMTEAMIDSTARIFDLIKAIKDYSYMDQAPIQEIDIPKGLESTLTMLQSRLGHVEVVREYEPDLPCISAYASELNQVWTALIENALDAIRDHGRIESKAKVSGDLLLVEVWDNGPGIPPEIQDRIFEPFFTTKPPGRGSWVWAWTWLCGSSGSIADLCSCNLLQALPVFRYGCRCSNCRPTDVELVSRRKLGGREESSS